MDLFIFFIWLPVDTNMIALLIISSPINTGGGAGTSDYVFTLMFGAFGIILSYHWFSGPVFTRNLTMFV